MTSIEWNRVTWYSQSIAIILFIGIFILGFYLGRRYEWKMEHGNVPPVTMQNIITESAFMCANDKSIHALFYSDQVSLTLSDGRTLNLPQVISASGARYANEDESFVFWNKGTTAFVTEGATTTFENCVSGVIDNTY